MCASSAREVRYNALYRCHYRLHARNVRRELLRRVSRQKYVRLRKSPLRKKLVVHGKNNIAEISKNLEEYKFEDNFVELLK